MPSFPTSTYYHYYPLGTTDMKTNRAIFCILKTLCLESFLIGILWMIGNYGLNVLFIGNWDTYDKYYIYLLGQLYCFLIPYTIFLYILLTMLFESLSLHRYCKHYILTTCIWNLLIIFAINAIIGATAHNKNNNESIFKSYIFGGLSIYVLFMLSTFSLYTIQIHSKSYVSIILQCLFCCKYRYWKLLCNKQYKMQQTKTKSSEIGTRLLSSSEIMSEFNVENETELQTKYLADEESTALLLRSKQINKKPNCCVRIYSKYSYCYYNLYSSHKLLLLLVVLNISYAFLFCFIILTLMDVEGTGHFLAGNQYERVMIIWLTVCYLIKLWMKYIGKHIDIIRLDIKLKYCTECNVKRQIYNLTKRISAQTSYDKQSSADVLVSMESNNYQETQNEVNEFKFDISFEITMEIFMQITYYSFYRDYSFIFAHPTWTQFIIFKIIHLVSIFMLYFIRIMPKYYKCTANIVNKTHPIKRKSKSPKKPNVFLSPTLTPEISHSLNDLHAMNSAEEEKGNEAHLNKQVSAYCTDPDIQHITTLDNIFDFYNRENNYKIEMKSSQTKRSVFDHTANITFDTYYDWRNRICIDCILRCFVMIFIIKLEIIDF